jgi:hypothetical protein
MPGEVAPGLFACEWDDGMKRGFRSWAWRPEPAHRLPWLGDRLQVTERRAFGPMVIRFRFKIRVVVTRPEVVVARPEWLTLRIRIDPWKVR